FAHGEPPPDEQVAPGTATALAPGECSLSFDVLGTVFVPKDPRLSMVTLHDHGATSANVFQVGDDFHGATIGSVFAGEDDSTRVELVFADGHRERCGNGTRSPSAVVASAASAPT